MAKVIERPKVILEVSLLLNQKEAAALAELAAWGADKAVDALAKAFGTGMLEEHREGLTSLLESSRKVLGLSLSRIEDCEKIFTGEKVAKHP